MSAEQIELHADGIILRQYTERDAGAAFALIDRNREHLSRNGDNTASKYPTEHSFMQSIVKPVNPRRLRFGIWVPALAGSINLTPDETGNDAEIGYYLGEEFQGKGYATRAVERLARYAFEIGIDGVYAKVKISNMRSQKILLKTGFSITGSDSDELYFSRGR